MLSWISKTTTLTDFLSIPVNRANTPGWESRIESIRELCVQLQDVPIMLHNGTDDKTTSKLMSFIKDNVCEAIVIQLSDLRSTIVKETTVLVQQCLVLPSPIGDMCVENILPQLYKNVRVTIAVVANGAEEAMESYFTSGKVCERAIRIAFSHCAKSHHKQVRIAASHHIALCVQRLPDSLWKKVNQELRSVLHALTGDATVEVRHNAKMIADCVASMSKGPNSVSMTPNQNQLNMNQPTPLDTTSVVKGQSGSESPLPSPTPIRPAACFLVASSPDNDTPDSVRRWLVQLERSVLQGDIPTELLEGDLYQRLFLYLSHEDDSVRSTTQSLLQHLMQALTTSAPHLLYPPMLNILREYDKHPNSVVLACLEYMYMHITTYYFTDSHSTSKFFSSNDHTVPIVETLTLVYHSNPPNRNVTGACLRKFAERMPWLFEEKKQSPKEELQALDGVMGESALVRTIELQLSQDVEVQQIAGTVLQHQISARSPDDVINVLIDEEYRFPPDLVLKNLKVVFATYGEMSVDLLRKELMLYLSKHLKGEDPELRKATVAFLAWLYIGHEDVVPAFGWFSVAQIKVIEIHIARLTNNFDLDLVGLVNAAQLQHPISR